MNASVSRAGYAVKMGDLTPEQKAIYTARLKAISRGLLAGNCFVVLAFAAGLYGTDREVPYVVAMAVGAFVLVNVCGIALRTALRPIPMSAVPTPTSTAVGSDSETIIDEPEPKIDVQIDGEELVEPALFRESDSTEGASLVEVEEVPTHPGLEQPNTDDLADQDTELDPDRAHLRNPDGPVLTVPRTAPQPPETPAGSTDDA